MAFLLIESLGKGQRPVEAIEAQTNKWKCRSDYFGRGGFAMTTKATGGKAVGVTAA
jgi:hypothetical protein